MSLPSSPGGDASSTIANDTKHLPNRPPREGVRGVGAHRLDEREEASIIYWLIVKHDGLGRRVFTTRLTGSEEVLPIFGHAEEAGEFLRLGKLENGWRVRGTGPESSSRCSSVSVPTSEGSRWTRCPKPMPMPGYWPVS